MIGKKTQDSLPSIVIASDTPGAAAYLVSIPQDRQHNGQLGLRPPAGVFNFAMARLLARFEDAVVVLTALNRTPHSFRDATPDLTKSLRAYQSLLYALMEYLEDCRNILRSLFQGNKQGKKEFHRHPAIKEYDEQISEHRNHVGAIVNALKHRQSRLGAVAVFDDHIFIPGYFVEAVHENGSVLGLNENIHEGGDSVISFYRDIRYHAVSVFNVAQRLVDTVGLILGNPLASNAVPTLEPPEQFVALRGLAQRISALPKTSFVNEILDPAPMVEVLDPDSDRSSIRLAITPPLGDYKTLMEYQISVAYTADGVTRSFRYPCPERVLKRKLREREMKLPAHAVISPQESIPLVGGDTLLYKFRSLQDEKDVTHAKDIILNNRLYCAPASSFNDPFECTAMLLFDATLDQKKRRAIAQIRKENPGIKEIKAREMASRRIAELQKNGPGRLESWIMEEMGIVSFAGKHDDLLMWAHYASGHTGLCIEFAASDIPHAEFFGSALRVKYQDELPRINFFKEFVEDEQSRQTVVTKYVLTKATGWQYESELRLFVRDRTKTPYFTFDPRLIRTIYVGCQISDEHVKLVKSWVAERGDPPIRLLQAKKAKDRYSLEFEPLD